MQTEFTFAIIIIPRSLPRAGALSRMRLCISVCPPYPVCTEGPNNGNHLAEHAMGS